jgi:hypothetical protein
VHGSPHFGTIVSKHYLAHARVMAHTALEHHPGARCTVMMVGEQPDSLRPDEPFSIVTPEGVGVKDLDARARRYDEFELAVSMKPHLIRHLLESSDVAVYLDCDIRTYAPFDGFADLVRAHGVVLTPHLTRPLPDDGLRPNEVDMLLAGTINTGFVGVAAAGDGPAFLDWWAERLREQCRVDHKRGLFVDQRWVDLAPGLFPGLELLRDPGFNVAYWNLPGRELIRAGGGYTVDGAPLRCFHFSGFNPDSPRRLSKHQSRLAVADGSPLAELVDGYVADLRRAGFAEVAGGGSHTYRRRTAREVVLDLGTRVLRRRGA